MVEYNAACTIWCGMRNQNIKPCHMKFGGPTSTGMSGSFNPPHNNIFLRSSKAN